MSYMLPESGTRKKLVPDCMTHVPEIGTSSLVLVSGAYVMGIILEHNGLSQFNEDTGTPSVPVQEFNLIVLPLVKWS